MRMRRLIAAGAGLLLVGSLAAIAQMNQQATLGKAVTSRQAETPFVTVLFRNWSAWDRNHDNKLSPEEIDDIVLNPSIKGDDAAAAGTLKLMVRNKDMKDVVLTRQYFQDYSRQRLAKGNLSADEAAELQTVDILNPDRWAEEPIPAEKPTPGVSATRAGKASHAATPDWDLFFSAGRHRISLAAGGWTGRFVLEHLRQGPLGDCFFISSLGSLLMSRPELVKSLVKPLNGSFHASYPGQAPFVVRNPTEAELSISSVSEGDGFWLAVMEQAFGEFKSKTKGLETDEEATDSISGGGMTGPTIDVLTGNSHTSIKLEASVERRKAEEAKVLPQLRTEMLAALRDHRVMTVSVADPTVDGAGKITSGKDHGTAPRIPPGINRRHAYAILAYDKAKDVIGIWNPHGQTFTPKGNPGLKAGYPTEHGRFSLPLTEAYSFFSNFTFEIPKPAKTKQGR